MKAVIACLFAYVALTQRTSLCGYNVDLTHTSPLTLLANDILSKLVNASVFDAQVAKNLLYTFGKHKFCSINAAVSCQIIFLQKDMAGVGAFADLRGSTAYASQVNIAYGGNVTVVGNFPALLSQLINSTTCFEKSHTSFVELLLKLALETKSIDAKTAMALSANYSKRKFCVVFCVLVYTQPSFFRYLHCDKSRSRCNWRR